MSKPRIQRRDVHGLVLLDKPRGLTSNQALQRVKYLFRARKAGHTGSLDPLATGLLPLCFGEATKLSAFLLDADKRYEALCRLGETTTTGDAEGDLLDSRPVPVLDDQVIEAALQGFRGRISQVPPMYSALKHQGQRLYELARRGEEVERQPRQVMIHGLRCLEFTPQTLRLEIHCSKGTYVRTLVEDIGSALGCGAHVISLRRTGLGHFDSSSMLSMDVIEARAQNGDAELDRILEPADLAVSNWPAVHLDRDSAHYLLHGQPVFVPGLSEAGWLRIYDASGRFLGLGSQLDDGRLAPRRLMVVPLPSCNPVP